MHDGEILLGYQCLQPMKVLSGMPVYLKMKVMPVTGNPLWRLVRFGD